MSPWTCGLHRLSAMRNPTNWPLGGNDARDVPFVLEVGIHAELRTLLGSTDWIRSRWLGQCGHSARHTVHLVVMSAQVLENSSSRS